MILFVKHIDGTPLREYPFTLKERQSLKIITKRFILQEHPMNPQTLKAISMNAIKVILLGNGNV